MASRATTSDILNRPKSSSSGGGSLSDAFVKLQPGPNGTKGIKTLRLIGFPIKFREHTATKYNPDNKNVPLKVAFPDAAQNSKPTRICTENDPRYGPCKYCEEGYRSSQKYSINVLERFKDEDGQWAFKVKILSKGPSIFEKFSEIEQANTEQNLENENDDLCTLLGGEVAHEVRIASEADSTAFGGVSHTVTVNQAKQSVLTEEEIAALAAIYKPTQQDLDALYAADPDMRNYPEWFVYGYRLDQIHKPSMPKRDEKQTPADALAMSPDENDDNSEPTTPAPAAAPKPARTATPKATPKARPAAVENPFDDEFDSTSALIDGEDSMP